MARKAPVDGAPLEGLLITRDFESILVSPCDLPAYSDLVVAQVLQRMTLSFLAVNATWAEYMLMKMFGPKGVVRAKMQDVDEHVLDLKVEFNIRN